MTTGETPDRMESPRREEPVFDVPQPDGSRVTLDFTTPGPFGDFAFAVRATGADGTTRKRVFGAYHTNEPAIFVEILQHWARVASPDDILAGLDQADAVRHTLTEGLEETRQSENDFDLLLEHHLERLAVMDFLPTDHEHSDERRDNIVIALRGSDLTWISQREPRTSFSVPPQQLWVFVTGMTWRTYGHDGIPLSRLNTAAYEIAVTRFRQAILSCVWATASQ